MKYKTSCTYLEFFDYEVTYGNEASHLVPKDTQPTFQFKMPYSSFAVRELEVIAPDGSTLIAIPDVDVDGREDVGQNWLWWSYNGGTYAMPDADYYRYKFYTDTGITYYSEPFKECTKTTHYLEWWNDCDMDDTVYQYGYKNRIYFDKVDDFPDIETTEESTEIDGVAQINAFSAHTVYLWEILRVSEHGKKALEMIRYHVRKGTVQVVEIATGEITQVLEFDVEFDDFNNQFQKATISMKVDKTISNACCENMTLNIAFSI